MVDPEDEIMECPECGHVGPVPDFYDESDVAQANGAFSCPECHAVICDWGD